MNELLQVPHPLLNNVCLKSPKSLLVKHLDALRPVLKKLAGRNGLPNSCADQAGRTIALTI